MGQTQILMIVLAIIIIAAAVAVGLRQFGKASEQADVDAALQDCQRISAAAMAWYKKPVELGGAGRSWTGFSFDKIDETGKTQGGAAITADVSSGDSLVMVTTTDKKKVTASIEPDAGRFLSKVENK